MWSGLGKQMDAYTLLDPAAATGWLSRPPGSRRILFFAQAKPLCSWPLCVGGNTGGGSGDPSSQLGYFSLPRFMAPASPIIRPSYWSGKKADWFRRLAKWLSRRSAIGDGGASKINLKFVKLNLQIIEIRDFSKSVRSFFQEGMMLKAVDSGAVKAPVSRTLAQLHPDRRSSGGRRGKRSRTVVAPTTTNRRGRRV